MALLKGRINVAIGFEDGWSCGVFRSSMALLAENFCICTLLNGGPLLDIWTSGFPYVS